MTGIISMPHCLEDVLSPSSSSSVPLDTMFSYFYVSVLRPEPATSRHLTPIQQNAPYCAILAYMTALLWRSLSSCYARKCRHDRKAEGESLFACSLLTCYYFRNFFLTEQISIYERNYRQDKNSNVLRLWQNSVPKSLKHKYVRFQSSCFIYYVILFTVTGSGQLFP